MLRKVSVHIIDWQVGKHFLAEEERELYIYAYEVLLGQVINVLLAILIATVFRAPIPVFVFLISYIPLRSYCGGYHAKTNGSCIIISGVLICGVCLIARFITGILPVFVYLGVFAISGVMIFQCVPIEDSNKTLDEKEQLRYRRFSLYIWFVEVVIGVILFDDAYQVGLIIALCHILLCIMLCLGILKNKRNKSQRL